MSTGELYQFIIMVTNVVALVYTIYKERRNKK